MSGRCEARVASALRAGGRSLQDIEVRQARPSDYRRIIAICFELGGIEGHLSGLRGITLSDLQHNRNAIVRANLERLRDASSMSAFVAEAQGTVVGYVLVRLRRSVLGDLEGWIQDIAVTEDFWGKGVGYRLLAAAEAFVRAQGGTALSMQVVTSNVRALRFCAKAGFMEERKQLLKLLH